jgi:electron transport complex protein RnfE
MKQTEVTTMSKKDNFLKGFFKENPIFVFLLGMCPALAVTATFETALGMGLLVVFVLTFSNIVVSLLRKLIPEEIRTPSYIVIIATFVTIVKMVTEAYAFPLYESLGVFIPLIVVNCLILGRAEAFASKNKVLDSAIDGIGMALGFTFALVVIGVIRELLATGSIMYGNYLPFFVDSPIYLFSLDWIIHIFNDSVFIEDFALPMFGLPPGAFIALGVILAVIQFRQVRKDEKAAKEKQAFIERKKKEALERKRQAALKKAGESA